MVKKVTDWGVSPFTDKFSKVIYLTSPLTATTNCFESDVVRRLQAFQ